MRKNNPDAPKPKPSRLRCAIYTRKSTEEGLDLPARMRNSAIASRLGTIAAPMVKRSTTSVSFTANPLAYSHCPLIEIVPGIGGLAPDYPELPVLPPCHPTSARPGA